MTTSTKDFNLVAEAICAQMLLYSKDSNTDRYRYATLWGTLRNIDAAYKLAYPHYNSEEWLAYCEKLCSIESKGA